MSEIYMDYHAVLGAADSIQGTINQLEAKREELESIRWRLRQEIEMDGEIESRLNYIDDQMRALHVRMAGIPQFLNDAVDAYIAADHRVQSLGDALNRQTAPIIKSIMQPTATGAKKPKGGTEPLWKKALEAVKSFAVGVSVGVAQGTLLDPAIMLSSALSPNVSAEYSRKKGAEQAGEQNFSDHMAADKTAYYSGKFAGDVGSTVAGGVEIFAGGVMAIAGTGVAIGGVCLTAGLATPVGIGAVVVLGQVL